MDSTEIANIIRRIAWQVSRGNREDREDFAQDLYVHLYSPRANGTRISKCDPNRPVEAFIYRVAQRLWFRRRRNHTQSLSCLTAEVTIDPADHRGRNDRVFLALYRLGTEPFSATDLQILATWQLDRRVILLAATHLHHKYPPELWVRDVSELASRRNLTISIPFPPHVPNQDRDRRNRYGQIAERLQTTPNNIAQIMSRNLHLLRQLECVQEAFRMLDWESGNDKHGSI